MDSYLFSMIFFTQETFQNVPIDIVEQYLGAAANTPNTSRGLPYTEVRNCDPIGKVEWKMASFQVYKMMFFFLN